MALSPLANGIASGALLGSKINFASSAKSSANNNFIGNGLSTLSKGILDTYSSAVKAQIDQARMANEASAAAQAMQYQYNLDMMNRQMDFNKSSAQGANELTKQMLAESSRYNAEEAQKNRDWQEYMSSTAYQRTVEDLKKAGLNPILAYSNGANSFGSGGIASIGTPSSAQATGSAGSVGNYSGQGAKISDQMAILGSVLGLAGEIINSAEVQKATGYVSTQLQSAKDTLTDWYRDNFGRDENGGYYDHTGKYHTGGGGGHRF